MPISNLIIPKILNNIRQLQKYNEEEIDMMRYSLQTILWETEKLLILGIFFLFLHRFDYFIITLAALISIRVNAGGFHSQSSIGCLMWTFLMFFLSIIILPLIEINQFHMIVILSLSFLITLYAAPVFHLEREHLLIHKAKKAKIIACIVTILWAGALILFKDNIYTYSVMWIIFLQNMQLLFEFIRRKKVRKNEKI